MSEELHAQGMTAASALKRLASGNERYRDALVGHTDVSPALRALTAKHGQEPYAMVITCSDSRVIPEAIFSASIGDLFVIRVAGNVIDDHQLGSIEYAASHLGVNLVLVLGHTRCGAIAASMESAHGEAAEHATAQVADEAAEYIAAADETSPVTEHSRISYVKFITDEIKAAIGDETDDYKACVLNVQRSISQIESSLEIQREEEHGLQVRGAVYHIENGKVDFL